MKLESCVMVKAPQREVGQYDLQSDSLFHQALVARSKSEYSKVRVNGWFSVQHMSAPHIHVTNKTKEPSKVLILCSPLGGNEHLLSSLAEFPEHFSGNPSITIGKIGTCVIS